MRQKRTAQISIFDSFVEHELGRELKAVSDWLDEFPEFIQMVADDLICATTHETGRKGFTAETVLRCAILKQYRQLSYEELAFYLMDSNSFRAFGRLPRTPSKSVLQATIGRVKNETWQSIHQTLLKHLKKRH